MKKIFFPFLMTFIVIGMVIPALAGSPNGGKIFYSPFFRPRFYFS